jgi:hypothetical protein
MASASETEDEKTEVSETNKKMSTGHSPREGCASGLPDFWCSEPDRQRGVCPV